jgi:pimeloyl-ACP methyl ester carboxylesterase/DNA-binding CsgD family transcriptional regulator
MKQQIQFCTSRGGTRIAFATAGKGPPVVRVNNWFTHLEFDWDSAVWRHWFDALVEGHTLVRYDSRGSGLSDRNVTDFSLDALVADLEAVADTLELRRFPILGLCQGGAIAVAYAARHPERVSRLVLYDSYVHGAYVHPEGDRMAAEARALAQMIEVGWGKETGAFREIFANLLIPDASRDQLRWISELQRLSASPKTARRLWDAFHTFDIEDIAAQVTAPTLVFHVRGDAMVPFESGRRLAAMIPNARFVPLESKNHILLPKEKAWRTFQDEFNLFLGADEQNNTVHEKLPPDLTEREIEILDWIARGQTNAEIAEALQISGKTVRNHISSIFSKLGVTHRAQAIVTARKAGLGLD